MTEACSFAGAGRSLSHTLTCSLGGDRRAANMFASRFLPQSRQARAARCQGVVAAASYWTAAAGGKKGLSGGSGGQVVRSTCATESVERRSRTR